MIENTSRRPNELHLLGMHADGQSDYIAGMEAAGQRQLVNSDRLPVDMRVGLNGARSEFEALGFTFGDPDPDDPLFCQATLPDGWRREPSEHDMWSYIVDETGTRRVEVFYKAAWYDRRAFMRLAAVGGAE